VVAAAAITLLILAAPAALAAPPEHGPIVAPPVEFAEGEVCVDPVKFENLTLRGKDTAFAPAPDGDERYVSRGSGVSRVTNLATDETYTIRAGVRFAITTAADGSFRVDARGKDFILWYYEGDDSELSPGLYQVSGTATEWYTADGSFIRATYSGVATDLCQKVGTSSPTAGT
jgi:hypothetical protein